MKDPEFVASREAAAEIEPLNAAEIGAPARDGLCNAEPIDAAGGGGCWSRRSSGQGKTGFLYHCKRMSV